MLASDSIADYNPLLDIDTSFASYLNARTRSYKDHLVGETMDYAFDADFSLKIKITAFSTWAKIYKSITSKDIPNRVKRIFQSSDAAGPLKYPEIYDAVNVCAERLQISVPTVYVKNSPEKYEIYSVPSDDPAPFIVATSGLIDVCSKEELRFLIGCECGHIQNRHCTLNLAAPYFGINLSDEQNEYRPTENFGSVAQIAGMYTQWIKLADVTGDRAGMICLSNPHDYPAIMADLHGKGVFAYYKNDRIVLEELLKQYDVLHITPARSIVLPKDCTSIAKRIFAGMEFLNCEILYNWRSDLSKTDIHTVNKQALEVRCEIILDAAKEGQ